MKLDLITVAAVAVAGLAVATWARARGTVPGGAPFNGSTYDPTMDFVARQAQQRRDSGAAIPANTSYLNDWRAYGATQPDF